MTDLTRSRVRGTAQLAAPTSLETPDRRLHTTSSRFDEGPLPGYFLVLVCLITLGGLLLRIPSFRSSLFGDEISTYFIVAGNSLSRVLRLVESNQETSPPLYFMVAWATKGLFSNTGESIRLISLVGGTAAIPLTFVLGLWTVGRRAALVGATCLALSPTMIYYSTQARPFMLALFLALLSTLALLRALDTGRFWWWAAYAAFTCGAAYTHYTVVFLLITQLVWALWTQPKARPAVVAANVVAGLAYLPWINGLREDLHAPNFINDIAPFNLRDIESILETTSIVPGTLTVVLISVGLVLGIFGLILKARDTRLQELLPPRTVLVVLLAFAPTALMLLYSAIRVDVFGSEFLIYSWPAFGLLVGVVVTAPRRPLWFAAVALTIAAFAIGGARLLGTAAQRPNVNAAVSYIERVGANGDPIVCRCFSEGPLTEVDVALADVGRAQHHPVLRLGGATQAAEQAPLSGPNPQPGYFLPVPSPQTIAKQAVALSNHGTIFLITYTNANAANEPAAALPHVIESESAEFLQALPSRFHVVGHMTYQGLSGLYVHVFVIRSTEQNR